MTDDRLLHIHRNPGEACIADGTADNGTHRFTTDVGQWNREARNCTPSMRLRPDYSISGRADPRTSALKDERPHRPDKEPR
jgi:hypothetical protein